MTRAQGKKFLSTNKTTAFTQTLVVKTRKRKKNQKERQERERDAKMKRQSKLLQTYEQNNPYSL